MKFGEEFYELLRCEFRGRGGPFEELTMTLWDKLTHGDHESLDRVLVDIIRVHGTATDEIGT